MKHRSFQFSLQIKNRSEKTMIKIKHFQYRAIAETDFLSNEGENEVRFLSEERNFLPNWRNLGCILFQLGEYWSAKREKISCKFLPKWEKVLFTYLRSRRGILSSPGRAATAKDVSFHPKF